MARKEREPGDDLISRLVIDHVATGALSRETATMNAVIMLQAGHETTTSVISLGMLALLQHPEQLARLLDTDDPAVVANVVGELMRYRTIVHSLVERVAVEDLVIAGQQIQAGARFPGLRLAVPESDKKIRNEQEIYGIESLPVTW